MRKSTFLYNSTSIDITLLFQVSLVTSRNRFFITFSVYILGTRNIKFYFVDVVFILNLWKIRIFHKYYPYRLAHNYVSCLTYT